MSPQAPRRHTGLVVFDQDIPDQAMERDADRAGPARIEDIDITQRPWPSRSLPAVSRRRVRSSGTRLSPTGGERNRPSPSPVGENMELTLLYFDGCPNWHEAESRLRDAMRLLGVPEGDLTLRRIETEQEARNAVFHGSPSFLRNGEDLFADSSAPVGMACRVYQSGGRLTGTPTVDELRAALLEN